MDTGNLEILVLRSQLGEQAAFEELFACYQPRLRYYLRRLDHNTERVEDLLQEIWIKVLRKINGLKDPKAFSVWLYTIARNMAFEKFRIKEPTVPLEADCPVEDGQQQTFTQEQTARLHSALERLEPHFREVLTLFYLEQMNGRQLARVLNCREGTIRTRLHYARRALRKQMEVDYE